ncbi:MAG: hypothetical protein ACPHV3_08990 [Vibrio sp.]
MNYSIAHHTHDSPFLQFHGRKAHYLHRLFYLTQGTLLVRLGQHEYVFQAGELCWLPAHCLAGVTSLPQTQWLQVSISTRLMQPYPMQAGKCTPNALLKACLNRLSERPATLDETTQKLTPELKAIYELVSLELAELAPSLDQQPNLVQWQTRLNTQAQDELNAMLTCRQALMAQASGKKQPQIIDELYAGHSAQFSQDMRQYLGKA